MEKVVIRGKEYDLDLTVQAFGEITDICPGKDFGRINEILEADAGSSMRYTAKILGALSRGAEMRKKYEDPAYKPNPIKEEMLFTMGAIEYLEFHSKVGGVITKCIAAQRMELEPSKKKGIEAQE